MNRNEMTFDYLKGICEEHNNCLKISGIIKKNKDNRHWFKVSTPNCGEFHLDEGAVKCLETYYEAKGLEIEKIVQGILYK